MRKTKNTNTVTVQIGTIDPYGDLDGLKKLVERADEALAKHPKGYVVLNYDYSGCYYESDTPNLVLELRYEK